MERIGFVGLGRMGQAIVGRLLAAGFRLTVYNRTRAKADEIIARGAAWADSPAEVAGRSDIIMTILTDDQAVEQVFLGERGLLEGDCAGKLFVEMSTIRTTTIHQLRPQVELPGARLLDAPVSGTVEPARRGELLVMVGGEPGDLERARPIFEQISRRIAHMGPSGAGTTMKLALNMPMAIFEAGLAEAMAIGHQFGLGVAQMLDIYLDSPLASPMLRYVATRLLDESHESSFDVTGVRKDLLAMVATGQGAGVPTPTGAAAQALFAAATGAGYGKRDLAFVVEYMIELAKKTSPRTGDET